MPFVVEPSAVDESLAVGVPAVAAASALALAKAREVAARLRSRGAPRALVLGADTLVVLDGRVFGKPGSLDEARGTLRALRGRAHEVVTGVALVDTGAGREAGDAVRTGVLMRDYADAEIDRYVETGEPADKAGAYAVQGAGARLVERVDGCYTNVVGLPLGTTARLLRRFGLAVLDPAPTGAPGGAPGSPAPR